MTSLLKPASIMPTLNATEPLREQGVRKIVMITGDARPVAEAVAADLGFRPGVDEVFAEVLPRRQGPGGRRPPGPGADRGDGR
jgi:hypothetical protein